MSKIIFSALVLVLSFNLASAKSNINPNSAETKALIGSKFFLNYQTFISHDKNGTSIDTVSNEGDYIEFAENGIAYMFYKGNLDSITYYFTENGEISFGDTPFIIKNLGNGQYSLFQNEIEKNGDYNSVTYMLHKDRDATLSYKN